MATLYNVKNLKWTKAKNGYEVFVHSLSGRGAAAKLLLGGTWIRPREGGQIIFRPEDEDKTFHREFAKITNGKSALAFVNRFGLPRSVQKESLDGILEDSNNVAKLLRELDQKRRQVRSTTIGGLRDARPLVDLFNNA